MKKIKTIFERDWDGNKKVIDKYIPDITPEGLSMNHLVLATEKIDGTNVRVTVRNHIAVAVQKRRNPTKLDKQRGIEDPWYIDIDAFGPQDKWVVDGVKNTDFSEIPDGEWSGELVGPNIQGNPLNLETNRVVFFSLGQCPVFENVPTAYAELRLWLSQQKSRYGKDCGIEGIVWHMPNGDMFKIKKSDF